MIMDEQGLFSNNQAITKSTESTNIINFGKREISFGTPVEMYVQVMEDFNNLTSLTITVQTSGDEKFTTPVDLEEQTILLSDLKKGTVSALKYIPKGNEGYIRLYYTVTGTAPTSGKIFAGIVDSQQQGHHNK